MNRAPLRNRWRALVYRTTAITASVKVTMLWLGDQMRDDGYVSVPRGDVARGLARHERKVSEHVAAAIDAGLLVRVSRGYEGHTAVYRAVLPSEGAGNRHPLGASVNGERVPKTSILSCPEIGTLSMAVTTREGAENRHPNRRTDGGRPPTRRQSTTDGQAHERSQGESERVRFSPTGTHSPKYGGSVEDTLDPATRRALLTLRHTFGLVEVLEVRRPAA